jgi:acyl-CoA synthetase (AMP-forming)/AMP-acid ligase II
METLPVPSSFVEILRARAAETPDRTAYVFLEEGESEEGRMTYADLDRRARSIAAKLQEGAPVGARVLLLYPPGLDYIAGIFGCLYAGMVAVPAYPPDVRRLQRSLSRLQAIVRDSGAIIALTTRSILEMAAIVLQSDPVLDAMRWLPTDGPAAGLEDGWKPVAAAPETLAILQYTSGSTGVPKGVMLSHGNLLHNSSLIRYGFDYSRPPVAMIWLPPYHDMGLIGGVLQPLHGGFLAVSMSPLAFLQRPLRWLQAISRYRGTACGGPNFAYDLCVRKTVPEDRAKLDLSCWEIAFCGAEPVRPETLARFAEAFAPSGFRREAFYPCYGLAEATLIVSGGKRTEPPVIASFERAALELGSVVETRVAGDATRALIGCGKSLPDQRIVIADPVTRTTCSPDHTGEIWVSGPSVAQGYWNRPEESRAQFAAHLADTGEGPFLRTEDLGFLRDGELFVTGRAKDVIILRGRNHSSEDIERTVEDGHRSLRPGCVAAVSIEHAGSERLVIVAEWDIERARQSEGDSPVTTGGAPVPPGAGVAERLQEVLWSHHDLRADAVVLVSPGTLPKTSSGKVQRFACRAAFADGSLEPLWASGITPERGWKTT